MEKFVVVRLTNDGHVKVLEDLRGGNPVLAEPKKDVTGEMSGMKFYPLEAALNVAKRFKLSVLNADPKKFKEAIQWNS